MARLRELREKIPLSQRELSQTTGIATATICRIEKGKQKPLPRTIRKLAKALGAEPGDIDFSM